MASEERIKVVKQSLMVFIHSSLQVLDGCRKFLASYRLSDGVYASVKRLNPFNQIFTMQHLVIRNCILKVEVIGIFSEYIEIRVEFIVRKENFNFLYINI